MTLRRSTALTRLVVLLCAATAALAIPRKGGSRIDTFLETKTTSADDISYLNSVSIKETTASKYIYAWATSGDCSTYPVAGSSDEAYEFQFVSTSSEDDDSSITYGTSIYLKSTVLDSYVLKDESVMQTGASYSSDDSMEIKLYLATNTGDESTITAGDSILIYSVDQEKYLNCTQDTACDDDDDVSKKFCQFNTASEDDAESFTINKDYLVNLYQYYDSTNVDHLWTTDPDEVADSYEYVGTVGKCYETEITGTTELYRAFWNGTQVNHFMTLSYTEYDGLATCYTREGVVCYVYSSEPSDIDSVSLGRGGNAASSITDHSYVTSDEIPFGSWTSDDDGYTYWYWPDTTNTTYLYRRTVEKYFYIVAPDDE